MPNDPLTEFVNGNYSHKPSAGELSAAKWFCRCLFVIFSVVFLWVFAILVNEVRPAWKLETAEAVVVSKFKKTYRRGRILRGNIHWTFSDQYDPEKKSVSGYDKVSLRYFSKTEIGDTIHVQYDPSKKRSPDNVRIKGSTPILLILSGLIFLCLLLNVNRYFLRMLRLARQDPVAFEKMIAENKRS